MNTNFFQNIVAMQVAGDWTINIARDTEDKLVVSVLFYNNSIGDEARKKVPPMIFNATPQELDEGFFDAITQPVRDTAQMFNNMEQYLKEREQARINSQMEKDKAAKEEKEKTERKKKYEEAMKKADELEAEGKHRDAYMKVPDPALYPEYEVAIKERRSALAKQFAPDLFNVEP